MERRDLTREPVQTPITPPTLCCCRLSLMLKVLKSIRRSSVYIHGFIPQMFTEQLLCAKQRAMAGPPPSHGTVIIRHPDR